MRLCRSRPVPCFQTFSTPRYGPALRQRAVDGYAQRIGVCDLVLPELTPGALAADLLDATYGTSKGTVSCGLGGHGTGVKTVGRVCPLPVRVAQKLTFSIH